MGSGIQREIETEREKHIQIKMNVDEKEKQRERERNESIHDEKDREKIWDRKKCVWEKIVNDP